MGKNGYKFPIEPPPTSHINTYIQPICRKKYCDRCLFKFLGEKPPRKGIRKDMENWLCPACRGICTCAACRRKKTRQGQDHKAAACAKATVPTHSPLIRGGTPNLGSRKYKLSPSSSMSPLPSASPTGKRKREEPLSEMLLARTAALVLKTPNSAPVMSIPSALSIPSLNLGSRAASPPEPDDIEKVQRVAHIRMMPAKVSNTSLEQVSTMQSIQEKLRRLSELTNIGDLASGARESEDSNKKRAANTAAA
ncbi:hypothetical protein AAMO2058_000751900 [Amorphochlora amoebiformis]